MGQVISEALMNLLSVQNLIFVNVGIFIGIIFGAIPGMNGNLAITVLLPFTFQMDTVPALLMLTAIFFGANFGGSISSILINTPGTNAAAATLIDGYPMCRNGQPRRALDMALVASTFGGLVSAFCGAVALGCSYILAYRDDFLGTDGYAQGTALASVSIDGHFRHRY